MRLIRRDRPGAATACRAASVLMLLWAAACAGAAGDSAPPRQVTGGNADRGKQEIVAYGCGACHMVPGIREAQGLVGPPLTHFASRAFIAGEVPNTSDQLIRWIMVPQAIEPHTAMPVLGVSADAARDIAAYLYTLR
jgi:cytochrome c